METIVIHRGRTVTVPVSLAYDVSEDTITSDIRVARNPNSELIAHWMVTHRTDGTDGELIFTIDDDITKDITHSFGYMDIKRITGGEPVNVLEVPIPVVIRDVVTP